jgi:subtilisin-like proprotein convertase family protein
MTSELTRTFNAQGLPLIDPQDGVDLTSVINVPLTGPIVGVRVTLDLSHGDLSELKITLRSPTGTEVVLREGQAGQDLLTIFPDASLPSSGSMDDYLEEASFGDWTLTFEDAQIGNFTVVNAWSLELTFRSSDQLDFLGDIDMHDNEIYNLSEPTTDTHATNKAYVDEIINQRITELEARLIGKVRVSRYGYEGDPEEEECNELEKNVMRNYKGTFQSCNGVVWSKLNGATYRWTKWATYDQHQSWFLDNRSELMAGLSPSHWGDSNGCAHQMTDNFDQLCQFYIRFGPVIGSIKNANIYLDRHENHNSSTNSFHVSTLFRIHNSTNQDIEWNVHWYGTSYGGWNEYRSIARNGKNITCDGGDNRASDNTNHNISIPPNRTSTVVFVASATHPSTSRSLVLYFWNDSLVLPEGLEFVDDFDTKPNGYDN